MSNPYWTWLLYILIGAEIICILVWICCTLLIWRLDYLIRQDEKIIKGDKK